MSSVSLKIAYSIITTGLFIMVVLIASTYEILDPNFYVVLIPLTAFLFLFGFAAGQRFTIPMKDLLKEADHLSRGDVKSRFYPESQDELGQLAKVFNRMAEEFERNQLEIKSLDTKVKLRTQTLEGIINVLEQKIKNRALDFERISDDVEKLQNELNLKNGEITSLKNQVASVGLKKTKKKLS